MIASLQGIRCLAIGLVFLSHLNFFKNTLYESFFGGFFEGGGAAGVSICIILSGFLMTKKYYREDFIYRFSYGLQFFCKKIKKFYSLHFLMLVFSFPFSVQAIMKDKETWEVFFLKLFLNLTLLQSYVPEQSFYFSLNAVSWYLSSVLFFYFATPFIFLLLHKLEGGGGKPFLG